MNVKNIRIRVEMMADEVPDKAMCMDAEYVDADAAINEVTKFFNCAKVADDVHQLARMATSCMENFEDHGHDSNGRSIL